MAKKRKVVRKTKDDDGSGLVGSLVTSIKKACGEDSAIVLDSYASPVNASVKTWVPSGFFWLDLILSGGRGIPCGKIIEIYGAEATGKTSLSQFFIKQFQRKGGIAVYLDFESSLDSVHLNDYGIDLGNLIYSSVDTVEEGFDVVQSVLTVADKSSSTEPILIVWDSVAMALPGVEGSEESHDKAHVGEQARAMSKGMRKIRRLIGKTNCTALFTNQTRDKIGVRFGDKKTTPGGNALKFAASIRLQTYRKKTLTTKRKKGGKEQVHRNGYVIGLHTKKTRFAPPHHDAEIILSFKEGPSPTLSAKHFLKECGLLKSAGTQSSIELLDLSFKTRDWKSVYKENAKSINKLMKEAGKEVISVDES